MLRLLIGSFDGVQSLMIVSLIWLAGADKVFVKAEAKSRVIRWSLRSEDGAEDAGAVSRLFHAVLPQICAAAQTLQDSVNLVRNLGLSMAKPRSTNAQRNAASEGRHRRISQRSRAIVVAKHTLKPPGQTEKDQNLASHRKLHCMSLFFLHLFFLCQELFRIPSPITANG